MLHDLTSLNHLDIEFRNHTGSNLVADATLNKMVALSDQGFRFIVGNHPNPKGVPYGAAEALKVTQLNHRLHGKSIRTIWAVKGVSLETVTLTNDFHGTEVTLRPHMDKKGDFYLSARQVKRAKKTLCGMTDCTCSGPLGYRGEQPQHDPEDSNLIFFHEERGDGTFEVWFGDYR